MGVFILLLMKELGNFIQRISMSPSFQTSTDEFSFPALDMEGGGGRFHHFSITVASSGRMLPGWTWPIQTSLRRYETVREQNEDEGLMPL